MEHLRDIFGHPLLGGGGFSLNQQLGMTEQQSIAQQFGLRAMTGQELAAMHGVGLANIASQLRPSPPSFEDWICTPNTETYQEYTERRSPQKEED